MRKLVLAARSLDHSLVLDDDFLKVTVSVGVAAADASNDFDVNQLFDRADRALYVAKSHPDSYVEAEPS